MIVSSCNARCTRDVGAAKPASAPTRKLLNTHHARAAHDHTFKWMGGGWLTLHVQARQRVQGKFPLFRHAVAAGCVKTEALEEWAVCVKQRSLHTKYPKPSRPVPHSWIDLLHQACRLQETQPQEQRTVYISLPRPCQERGGRCARCVHTHPHGSTTRNRSKKA